MGKSTGYHAEPICRAGGSIDIGVRSPEGKVICTTLDLTGGDVIAAITEAYRTARLIADALNAYQGGQP